jgi:hypothetical protein
LDGFSDSLVERQILSFLQVTPMFWNATQIKKILWKTTMVKQSTSGVS